MFHKGIVIETAYLNVKSISKNSLLKFWGTTTVFINTVSDREKCSKRKVYFAMFENISSVLRFTSVLRITSVLSMTCLKESIRCRYLHGHFPLKHWHVFRTNAKRCDTTVSYSLKLYSCKFLVAPATYSLIALFSKIALQLSMMLSLQLRVSLIIKLAIRLQSE